MIILVQRMSRSLLLQYNCDIVCHTNNCKTRSRHFNESDDKFALEIRFVCQPSEERRKFFSSQSLSGFTLYSLKLATRNKNFQNFLNF